MSRTNRRSRSSRPARARRRRARAPLRLRVDRRAWVLLAALALVLALPAGRRAVRGVADVVARAVAAARASGVREREIEAYARRYGISRDMADAVERAARAEGVETELAFRLVRVESAFRERAVSPVGAVGLTQLMPATAQELQPGITREQMFDRDTNLRLGFRYFRQLLRQYRGDTELALHAYNRGMGTVARIRAAGGDPANGYARQVLGEKGASPVRPGAGGPAPPPAPAPAHEMGPARPAAGL